MSEITIYHNPACGTSRNTLGLIRAAGFEPQIIEYLQAPPDRAMLESQVGLPHSGIKSGPAMRKRCCRLPRCRGVE
jgi:arsenate reductase-like glutaredoxin family protein